jgi:hypothetical protein
MQGVVGGGLPAVLWHELMLIARPGSTPAVGEGERGAYTASDTAPEADAPRLPREPIGAEFVARALGASADRQDASEDRRR